MTPGEIKAMLENHAKWLNGAGPRPNLQGVDLWDANLRGADLRDANLLNADLRDADLWNANLRGANLQSADLRGANLLNANLRGANLQDAYLRGANLQDAYLPPFQIPDGDLIVYKKLNQTIATLRIESHVKRTGTLVGRKCRAASAFVMSISNGFSSDVGWHRNHPSLTYTVGEYVYPDKYDDDIRVECTNGIHFFLTRKEAEEI